MSPYDQQAGLCVAETHHWRSERAGNCREGLGLTLKRIPGHMDGVKVIKSQKYGTPRNVWSQPQISSTKLSGIKYRVRGTCDIVKQIPWDHAPSQCRPSPLTSFSSKSSYWRRSCWRCRGNLAMVHRQAPSSIQRNRDRHRSPTANCTCES